MRKIKKLYGPYKHAERSGRKFIIRVYADGTEESTTVARHLMELHIGRELDYDETVDHINGDPSDDRLENLRILSRAENTRAALKGTGETGTFECAWCGVTMERDLRIVRRNQGVRKCAGPFCSKSCVGKYGTSVQKDNKVE